MIANLNLQKTTDAAATKRQKSKENKQKKIAKVKIFSQLQIISLF